MKQLLVFLSIAAVLVFAGSPQAADYPKMTIRAATANPDGGLHVLAIDKFKEIVEKESMVP